VELGEFVEAGDDVVVFIPSAPSKPWGCGSKRCRPNAAESLAFRAKRCESRRVGTLRRGCIVPA
jgi:hypothetical protein